MKMNIGFTLRCLCLASMILVASSRVVTQIPSMLNFTEAGSSAVFQITSSTQIVVDSTYAHSGSPSLEQFVQTFRDDLVDITGYQLPDITLDLTRLNTRPDTIFITMGAKPNLTYNNGKPSPEGYEMDVTATGIVISGVQPIGAWWGTRTLLQTVVLRAQTGSGHSVPVGNGFDAPGWEVRGFMLDAGRHWFESSFLGKSGFITSKRNFG
jgi:hexosaminidase